MIQKINIQSGSGWKIKYGDWLTMQKKKNPSGSGWKKEI